DDPFDYDWGRQHPYIGCNHLRCGSCGQLVTSAITADGRRYACRCQTRVETDVLPLDGSDQGTLHELVTAWGCDEHPALDVPGVIDGEAVTADPVALDALVERGLSAPPRTPPGTDGPAFWVTRLYWLVPEAPRPATRAAAAARP